MAEARARANVIFEILTRKPKLAVYLERRHGKTVLLEEIASRSMSSPVIMFVTSSRRDCKDFIWLTYQDCVVANIASLNGFLFLCDDADHAPPEVLHAICNNASCQVVLTYSDTTWQEPAGFATLYL